MSSTPVGKRIHTEKCILKLDILFSVTSFLPGLCGADEEPLGTLYHQDVIIIKIVSNHSNWRKWHYQTINRLTNQKKVNLTWLRTDKAARVPPI
ncbi:unnamed protein product [Acanthoscelides obtectus]|uniref:Uncharacterized protein n=1 Tax=Acanthoscelides obtectus TaxID=200917 RepID=A0A9P0LEM1_ACAOB|nr:unnamed protein product [Acanthoscelides obtectus]CAK1630821.1 hypothetical protein AOBTE_LOCUS6573 [Acanthoscelides obtectus]